jgi:predicted dienelactone hydrolase
LAYYTNRLRPEQVAKLPTLLSTPLELNPLTVANFSNSLIGEAVIKNFGKGIRSDLNHNGFYAIRSAAIASGFAPEGLTIINLLHHFPLETIYIDLQFLGQYLDHWFQLLEDREIIARTFFQPNIVEKPNFLQQPGQLSWSKETLTYKNPHRSFTGYFDLYIPRYHDPVPVIIISHGIASSRRTFAYLAKHLVSHGFAVVVIEHPDTNLDKFDGFLEGSELFPKSINLIEQPRDVQYVLDKLEQQARTNPKLKNKLTLQQIGAIGQSFGGYTVLALGGGKLDRDESAQECQEDQYDRVLLDLSSLAKCTFNDLPPRNYQLQDKRIKAIIAINPLGKIFGQEGISNIKIPTMIVSGTNDLVTPPVAEQIIPFTWLKTPQKYLVLVQPGTHFSFLEEGIGVLPVPDNLVGPSSHLAHPAIQALSTGFFKTYIAQESKYQIYLTRDRVAAINSLPFQLSLIRYLNNKQWTTNDK